MVSQVQGSFEARDTRMKEYLRMVRQVMNQWPEGRIDMRTLWPL